jgi:hypothetical protein
LDSHESDDLGGSWIVIPAELRAYGHFRCAFFVFRILQSVEPVNTPCTRVRSRLRRHKQPSTNLKPIVIVL